MSPNEPCKSAEDWQLTAPQEESGTHLALQAYALPAYPRAPPPPPPMLPTQFEHSESSLGS